MNAQLCNKRWTYKIKSCFAWKKALTSLSSKCKLSTNSASPQITQCNVWVTNNFLESNAAIIITYPPTAYSLFPIAATPTRARRVDMDATMCQRSVLVSYASQSPWIANKLPPPGKEQTYTKKNEEKCFEQKRKCHQEDGDMRKRGLQLRVFKRSENEMCLQSFQTATLEVKNEGGEVLEPHSLQS